MKSRTKTALGIDINDRCISAALVEKTDQGFRIIAAANGNLWEDGPEAPASSPGKAMARVLRKLGRRARMYGVRKAVTVSTKSVIVRLLDLPRQMPTNIGEFVNSELKQYVALSGRRMSSDFCGVGMEGGSRKRLLAAAADAGEMEEIVETCRAAGVSVDSVEPAAVAYARAFRAGKKNAQPGGHALIGVLGSRTLAVCVFSMGILDLVRTRDVPAGMDTPGALCAWLAEEMNAVLRYYRMDVPGGNPEWQLRLVLYDPARSRDEIAPLLVLEPGMTSAAVVDCCEGVELPPGAAGPSAMPSLVAVGAALRWLGMEGDYLRIDLTPQEVVRARSSARRVMIVANAAAILFLAIALIVQFLTKTGAAMNRRIEQRRVAEQLYAMPAQVAQDRFLDAEILRMQRELAGLEAARARQEVDWPAVLSTIGGATPAGVCITHMVSVDGGSLSLTGSAASPDEARMFVQDLDGRTPFESVGLTRMQRPQADAEVVEYQIDCVLRTMKRENDSDSRS